MPDTGQSEEGVQEPARGLDRTVRSGWGQGEVLGGQAEKGDREDRAERDRALCPVPEDWGTPC